MDVLSPLLLLALKSLVVLFPMTVVWLAFRRLALSKSDNAWIYASMCLFAAVTAAGVLPWALGIAPLNWLLLSLAVLCPALWVGVIMICDVSRVSRYGTDTLADAARMIAKETHKKLSPLVLENPKVTPDPLPVFRHTRKETPKPKVEPPTRSRATRTILTLARDIRGNATSERRRPKLLPAPEGTDMPFLNRSQGG